LMDEYPDITRGEAEHACEHRRNAVAYDGKFLNAEKRRAQIFHNLKDQGRCSEESQYGGGPARRSSLSNSKKAELSKKMRTTLAGHMPRKDVDAFMRLVRTYSHL
jgi:hypothetical protein